MNRKSFHKEWVIAFIGLAASTWPARTHAGLVLYSTMDDADIISSTVSDLALPAQNGTLQSNVATGVAGQIGQAIAAARSGAANVGGGTFKTDANGIAPIASLHRSTASLHDGNLEPDRGMMRRTP